MIALIPLRGGSKGIPGKNIKPIAGRPLCTWVIDEAIKADIFDWIIVSTDCEKIARTVSSHIGPRVEILMRPPEISTDDSPTEEAMLHCAAEYPFDVMCLIQATSPLTEAYAFKAARAKFTSWGADSLLTVTELRKFVWTAYNDPLVEPVNYDPEDRPMREGIMPVYIETGNFYFTTREVLVGTGSRLGGNIGRYIIDRSKAVDIDDMEDFKRAEMELNLRRRAH